MIDAQRVPPSACSTSQSTQRVRSPSAFMSTTARSERPIRRWISCVRPDGAPFEASRCERVCGGARQHAVLGGDPALALALEEGRDLLLDAHRAHDARVADLDEARALGVLQEPGGELHRPQLGGVAAVGRARRSSRSAGGVDLPAEVAEPEAHGAAPSDRRRRSGARQPVQPAVLLPVREHDHHVVAGLGERDPLDEVLGGLLAARPPSTRPPGAAPRCRRRAPSRPRPRSGRSSDAGSGSRSRGWSQDRAARRGWKRTPLAARDRAAGRRHHLHQAARSGAAQRARVEARLLQDQRRDERRVQALLRAAAASSSWSKRSGNSTCQTSRGRRSPASPTHSG